MENLLNWVHDFFLGKEKNLYTGANLDPRTLVEFASDYTHEELGTSADQTLVYYLAYKPSSVFPYEDQGMTNQCGPHAATLAMGANEKLVTGSFVRLSKDFFYRYRSNFPTAGMYLQELGSIAKGVGSCLQTTVPTSLSDTIANKLIPTENEVREAAIYKQGAYLQFQNYNDIDTLAHVINGEHRGVILFVYATYREWAQEYPDLLDNPTFSTAPIRHFVCAIPDGAYVENGKRYLTIQDSAHFGSVVVRRLSEDFVRARVIGALYFKDLNLTPGQGVKPVHFFKTALALGARGLEVSALQRVLVYEGLLPAEAVTGNFLGMTLAAVRAYQAKYAYDILIPNGLTAPTGFVGAATLKHLNLEYGQ